MDLFTQNKYTVLSYVILIAALLFKYFLINMSLKSFTKLVFKYNNNNDKDNDDNKPVPHIFHKHSVVNL